jgi:hypothetical protein
MNLNPIKSENFLFVPLKGQEVESVRVKAQKAGYRIPTSNSKLASIVKDELFANRILFSYSPLEDGHIRGWSFDEANSMTNWNATSIQFHLPGIPIIRHSHMNGRGSTDSHDQAEGLHS